MHVQMSVDRLDDGKEIRFEIGGNDVQIAHGAAMPWAHGAAMPSYALGHLSAEQALDVALNLLGIVSRLGLQSRPVQATEVHVTPDGVKAGPFDKTVA